MKRWKKISLLLLLLLLLSQTPFIYRRYKLGRLAATIRALNAERAAPDANDPYSDHKGVVHVHSQLGGHSTGGFDDIVRAAKSNGLSFVLMTEHPSKYVDTSQSTLRGLHEGVLFVGGSEINAAHEDRLLVLPGVAPPDAGIAPPNTQQFVNQAKGEGGRLVFVAYPEQLRSWDLQGIDGIEIYNLYTNSKKIRYGLLFFDGLWSYWSYPHLLFSTFYEKPETNLKKWDELTASGNRRLVAIAGNDAHQNVGLRLQEQTGEPLLQIQLDPYERSFRIVRTHVLVEKGQPLSTETLLAALAAGHSYIAFDLFADATGFRFTAENESEKKLLGDELMLNGATRLVASAPVKSRIRFIRDGEVVHEEKDALRKELPIDRKGVYRVEVYLDRLGEPLDEKPWIISNPIYVR
jgi:hypothetical protein